ncbi:MAG: response regulator transcription factor [Oscillospiraceae bacterium]|nr:response regulator transcription factor [Oscillospiraceae bacterium]
MKQTIFAVEDDIALQELYQYSLETDFECRCFDDGVSFFSALFEYTPDLILLDIMLPGEDGFSILSRLKSNSKTAHIPIIIISAKDEEVMKVMGLNMGADDYIAKPFGVSEFTARIKANIRKNTKTDSLSYKDILLDFSKHSISIGGSQIHTTLKEYNLLCFLCLNADMVQTREVIFSEIWDISYIGETRTLDIHIKELRKKLAEANSEVEIITIRGVGYMLK